VVLLVIEIEESTLKEVKKLFEKLEEKVTIFFFRKPKGECVYCEDTLQILKTIAGLSDKITVIEKDHTSEEAKKYNIPMYPAILIHGKDKYNIRFFGIPAGYEFGALVEDIVDASTGHPKVDPRIAEIVKNIDQPVRIMVFVTPTCPYCPIAVRASHRFAILNKNIYGDMIEALEFNKLADKYGVFAVPKIVINDKVEFEGAMPDSFLLSKILEALGRKIPEDLVV